MSGKASGDSQKPSATTRATKPGDKNAQVEPMIPHKTREEADLTPHAPPKSHQDDAVEPMIPHNKRKDME